MHDPRSAVIGFCTEVGADPLLVQGAGGNVSWKENGVLWVKASGTWLADAATREIFTAVDLVALRRAIGRGDYPAVAATIPGEGLRPSIETALHALMPHTVVVHLHAVDILAHLVRRDCARELERRLGCAVRWEMVEYFRPGARLAGAVGAALARAGDVEVVFLKNHGVVIGGSDVAKVRATLGVLLDRLREPVRIDPRPDCRRVAAPDHPSLDGYVPVDDEQLHRLATDEGLFDRLETGWALYPDHVVFLGARARRYQGIDELRAALVGATAMPELVFLRGVGVFVTRAFGKAGYAQLRCYYDVLVRQPEDASLDPLAPEQIAELLGGDDEQYRIRLGRA